MEQLKRLQLTHRLLMQEQLNRIEEKLDDALKVSAKNEVRIKFLGLGIGTVFVMIGTYIKSKLGI